ncbi:thiamine pyrophosphate-binding protein [Mycobacterium sp. MS1601]|uniref:thiamine pyrophosphate-binding protein n=1 Tax=Mycobacterium sp. MS1601 TaxID=1936029 RepID=UPI0018D4D8AD|nr:thiamine pyrophosphate-binding protein [Mycobacterium sp. MS1601]
MAQIPTVIGYVLGRLHQIGVSDIFGVPGDYAFPVHDAIVAHPDINWIGCCNELNAGFAADGYARLRGVGALTTTFGVGELGAISAVAGAYAERLPVFHLTGMPNRSAQADRALVHHTLGNGEFDLFKQMADTVTAASAIITPPTPSPKPNVSLPQHCTNAGRSTWRSRPTSSANRSPHHRRPCPDPPATHEHWLPRPTPWQMP